MKLLAIDTSSSALSFALGIEGKVMTYHVIAPQQQTKTALEAIDSLLSSAHLEVNQLDAIAVGRGPGSFTGVRIAISLAQGLAFAADLPVIPISSLAGLAQAAFDDLGWKKLGVAVDARIQEVYWGFYEVDAQGLVELKGQEILSAPESIIFPSNMGWYGVGDGWSHYKEALTSKSTPLAMDPTRLPMAIGVLRLAQSQYNQGHLMNVHDLEPIYLRNEIANKSIKSTR